MTPPLVGQLSQLTRLEFKALFSWPVAAALAASLTSGGLALLRTIDLNLLRCTGPRTERPFGSIPALKLLLDVAAAGTKQLTRLACRNVDYYTHPLTALAEAASSFGPAAPTMDLLITPHGHHLDIVERDCRQLANSDSALLLALEVGLSDQDPPGAGAGPFFDIAAVGAAAIASALLRHRGRSTAVVDSMTVWVALDRIARTCALNLSALPPSLSNYHVHFNTTCTGRHSCPVVSGSAAALTSLSFSAAMWSAPDVPPSPPVAALAAGCPHLLSLTYRGGGNADSAAGSGISAATTTQEWVSLSQLRCLEELILDHQSRSPGLGSRPSALALLSTSCMPPSLVKLTLCGVRVSAEACGGRLSHLQELSLCRCAIKHLGAFAGAGRLRTLTLQASWVDAGHETLFGLRELEDLDSVDRPGFCLVNDALTAAHVREAATAGAAAGPSAAGPAARACLAALPRLRRLRMSANRLLPRGRAMALLTQRAPNLQMLHLDTDQDTRAALACVTVPRPCAAFHRLVVLQVSGVLAGAVQSHLQVVLPHVVGEVVAA